MIANTFDASVKEDNLNRLEKLTVTSKPNWGKMNASQMLAHLNVPYKMALDENTTINRGFKRFIISLLAKKQVVSEKPYPKNGRTAPEFIIADERDFEKEKTLLINNINEVFEKGTAYFNGKESASFGPLSEKEWSNLFQKHINHHFEQFGL
ncbi:MAG: DUF1569 domain-containing protein [Chitinophagales bacterium]